MAAISDAGGVEEVFEHCEVTWKIENYFLATFGKDWIVNSPEIYVTKPWTKWKMFLTPDTKKKASILINLQRLEYGSEETKKTPVWAAWLMTLVAKEGVGVEKQYETWEEQKMYFETNEFHSVVIFNRELIKHYIEPPFEDKDILYIRLQLFVSHEIIDEKYGQFGHDDNWVNLQNFIKMHADGKNHDIEIVIGSLKVKAHKEVLSLRSLYFKNNISPGTKCITLNLDQIEFANIIAYLYSGDLKYVLSRPNSVLHHCITELEIEELKLHYSPNLMKFDTALDVQYDEFDWVIKNFSKIENGTTITSPIIYDSGFKTCWQLKLQIKVVKKSMSMSLTATSMASVKPEKLVHIEFVPMRKRNFFQRIRKTAIIEGTVTINKDKFFHIDKSRICSSKKLPGDKLHIIFKIQILLNRRVSERKHRSVHFVSK